MTVVRGVVGTQSTPRPWPASISFHEPLVRLKLAEPGGPAAPDSGLLCPIVIDRRRERKRPRHRNRHDGAQARGERAAVMAEQRFEGVAPALDHLSRAGKSKTLAHEGIDEVDLDARIGPQVPDRAGRADF